MKKTFTSEEQQELETLRWTAEQSRKNKAKVERIRDLFHDARLNGQMVPRVTEEEYLHIVRRAFDDLAHSYGDHIAECAKQIVKIEGDAGIFGSAFEPKK